MDMVLIVGIAIGALMGGSVTSFVVFHRLRSQAARMRLSVHEVERLREAIAQMRQDHDALVRMVDIGTELQQNKTGIHHDEQRQAV